MMAMCFFYLGLVSFDCLILQMVLMLEEWKRSRERKRLNEVYVRSHWLPLIVVLVIDVIT
jgi:hypothetical protein